MIVFDLQCGAGCTPFEAWFRSTADYEDQRGGGLVQCPYCNSAEVEKAPMAPRVPRKSAGDALQRLSDFQAEHLANSRWVGDDFVETARAMHNGEREAQQVHGNASLAQAKALADEGIPVAPLPFPVTPPNQVN